MTQHLGALIADIGFVVTLWGGIWLLWDKRAIAPGWLLGIGLVCLLVGGGVEGHGQ